MSRKSKAKYEMKGHSIPGIKGFKNTTLEDGKAASSAFQMQSPLYVEGDDDGTDAYKLDDINVKSSDYDPNRATTQRAGQSGASYGLEQLGKLAGRKRDKKAAEKMEDQTTKYDDNPEGSYEEYLAEVGGGEGALSMAEWSELNSQNVDPDMGKGEVDTNIETYVDPSATTEDLTPEKIITPNVELDSPAGDPYSYRATEDGGYAVSYTHLTLPTKRIV